jgi:hypothetical protein
MVQGEKKIEEINHNLEMMRQYHIQETVLNLAPIIFNQLDIAGFGLAEDEDEDLKDGAFIVESLRSIMYKYYDMYHPFQDIAENVFVIEKDSEETFKIVDEINLKFRTEDETPNEE